jgi:hypothetical protein
MRSLILCLALPGPALAWELVTPGAPAAGVVSTTTVTDFATVRVSMAPDLLPSPNLVRTHWVAFADEVGVGCRLLSNIPEAEPPGARRNAGSWNGRYAFVELAIQQAGDATTMPVLLFARANNLPVRVKLLQDGGACRVVSVQTCSDPANCPDP